MPFGVHAARQRQHGRATGFDVVAVLTLHFLWPHFRFCCGRCTRLREARKHCDPSLPAVGDPEDRLDLLGRTGILDATCHAGPPKRLHTAVGIYQILAQSRQFNHRDRKTKTFTIQSFLSSWYLRESPFIRVPPQEEVRMWLSTPVYEQALQLFLVTAHCMHAR